MGETRKTRLGTTAALKARKVEDHILLARGLSARQTGANVPLTCLAQDEIERDLRHMEAFSNACTSYAQQYYRYHNQSIGKDIENDGKQQLSRQPQPAPLIAMPVRIDPEEEKRLANLRQKIQQCEAQREVYEGQYLSLRAHYIYLSQQLKVKREDVDQRIEFLKSQVNKRGKLVALQRVRLQILRDTLQCVQYREKHSVEHATGDAAELYTAWNDIETKWKKAEDDLKSNSTGGNILRWSASEIPKIPPGVPLLLSQLAEQPGQAAAWGTCGAFGAKPYSMLWIDNQLPVEAPDTAEDLHALREEESKLKKEIERERSLSKGFQFDVISRRKKNDELVAMMTLLRTETEAAVTRHNIILESDIAKKAALKLHEEEEEKQGALANDAATEDRSAGSGGGPDESLPKSSGLKEDDENDGDDEGGAEDEEDEGEILEDGSSKRSIDGNGESPRSKRRKV